MNPSGPGLDPSYVSVKITQEDHRIELALERLDEIERGLKKIRDRIDEIDPAWLTGGKS